MKRGRGPKRRTRLEVSPEKVRAFEQRGRERAVVERKGRQHLRPGQIGAGSPAPSPEKGRVEFRGPLLAGRSCWACLRRDRSRPGREWHHWLPQRLLREYVRSLRLDAEQARTVLRRLLHDERNLSPVCLTCHDAHEHPGVSNERFGRADVPASAIEFAVELGPEWAERLRRLYPAAGCSGGCK